MDIEKLIAEITDQVYNKVSSDISSGAGQRQEGADLAKYIDHTLLKADATKEQIIKICDEAKEYKFASVCVNSSYVPLVAEQLSASGVKTCCVVGFPLGAASTEAKVQETIDSIKKGADEVDMVINIGAVKSKDWAFVKDDIENVVLAARGKALVKVIIEACLLTDEEKVKVCAIAKMAGADFVKTSTGFSTGGATVSDVKLMRQTVGEDMGVKASGGVKDYKTAKAMIEAGATRIGTSNGISIAGGAVSGQDETGHACVGCGNCTKKCPSGRVDIVVTDKY
ncbi:deoxyribose-phosphate aldolase [Lachnospiraceae bacterium]|nr:deoxyribose-phosphate aldolase [Extibacter sp. GGCC_0201]MBO1720480.1 deoxyribose-phosphate aldolase [Extibacter sp. GGCC_0201]BDF34581.1 deoxyribose-phosphate aldolase [Lachnospiraceae bacterium]BDF38583.1 deoxyribose-phosphate aldolase [Lachnospiraceae bacterium]